MAETSATVSSPRRRRRGCHSGRSRTSARTPDGEFQSFVHRVIREDVLADPTLESVTEYDPVGANTERLSECKGQFGGNLRPYYGVEPSGPEMDLAQSASRWFDDLLPTLPAR